MVASLLIPADVLARPPITAKRQSPTLIRDYAYKAGGMRFLQATGAEIVEKGIDEGTMSFAAIISTADVDRVGDILEPEGCDFQAYSENALVFLNHQSEHIPIGTCWDAAGKFYFSVEPKRVLARCFCVQGGEFGQDATDIFHLVVQRAFNDVSVGFNPHHDPRYTVQLNTGGNHYKLWEILEWGPVGIGCNRAAKIIRKYLTDGKITGKHISPRLVKMLTPLAEPTPAQVTSGFAPVPSASAQSATDEDACPVCKGKVTGRCRCWIGDKFCKNKHTWHVCPVHNRVVLGSGHGGDGSRQKGDCTCSKAKHMSKKWGKPGRSKRNKAMSESSGTAGGYAVAEEPKAEEQEATGHETMKAIRGVMEKHKGEAHADGPHDAYFNLDTGNVFHHHHKDASAEHLSLCKSDMESADGVAGAEQGTEAPTDKAYVKVFGGSEENKPEEEPVEKQGVTTVTKKKKPSKSSREDEFWRRYQGALDETGDSSQAYAIVADEMGKRGKLKAEYTRKAQLAFHVGRGRAYRQMAKMLPKKKKDALEECVHHKIPKIAEDHPEMAEDQRTAVAYSMCGEKAFGHDAYENKEETEQPGGATTEEYAPGIPADIEDNKQPPSLTLCQQAIENIEAALPGMEPETREFWEHILQEIRDHGMERYPQEDFGGAETKADEPTTEEAQEFAGEVTDAYRETPEQREQKESKDRLEREREAEKRAGIQLRKSMRILRKGDHPEILRASADHHHAMSKKSIGSTHSKADREASEIHGRAMDRLHGAVTAYMKAKAEEEEPDEREMEDATGTADNPVPEAPDPEGTDDEAPAEVEKLFAAAVDKAVNGDGATTEVLKRIDAMRERLTGIYGTRF